VNVSLTQTAGTVIVGTFFMNAALTTQTLTRATVKPVVVPRDCRMSWLATRNYPVTGKQKERS